MVCWFLDLHWFGCVRIRPQRVVFFFYFEPSSSQVVVKSQSTEASVVDSVISDITVILSRFDWILKYFKV